MRGKAAWLAIPAVLGIFGVSYLAQHRGSADPDADAPADPRPKAGTPYRPTPVALNRGPEVQDGFRGEVHPLLFGRTRLPVTARWTSVGKGRDVRPRDPLV